MNLGPYGHENDCPKENSPYLTPQVSNKILLDIDTLK